MEITRQNQTLSVSGIRDLNSANARSFHAAVATALAHDLQTIEIDLSQTHTVDGAGLGALLSLYETANQRRPPEGITLRLKNPTSTVQQMIELVRLHHLFEITRPGDQPDRALRQ